MKISKKAVSILLVLAMLLPTALFAGAETSTGVVIEKNVTPASDGTYDVDIRAYHSGKVMPLDIVMVLDVSGSMENNVAVKKDDINPDEDYYIEFLWQTTDESGKDVIQGKKYKTVNISPDGAEPVWQADIEGEKVIATPIEPGDTANKKGEYVFYTGAIDDLQRAVEGFTDNIAKSAEENGVDHRIAVVEFSSPVKKSESCSLNTHESPFYANILTGNKSPETALVSATEENDELKSIFASLKAEGATYSDDALTQAKRIFEENNTEDRKRFVVLFTDGGPGSYGWSSKTVDRDFSSIPTANAAIACANEIKSEYGAEIYTIGFFDPNELDTAVEEKNQKYLAYISSNHKTATDMDSKEEPILDGYCNINNSNADLEALFESLSTVLGDSIENVEVRDTISPYFCLTKAQKDEITKRYENAVVTEYRDGTTVISVSETAFPQIKVDENGKPLDENDSGIFKLSYSMTRKDRFIGGNSVPVDTGETGVYHNKTVCLAKSETVKTDVPVSEDALKDLISVNDVTITEGAMLNATDFFNDMSDNWYADFADITYTVTDKNGNNFTSATVTVDDDASEFTVTATVNVGGTEYTVSDTVTLSVERDSLTGFEITGNIKKTSYFVGDTLNTAGFELSEVYKSGKKVPVSGNITFSPTVLNIAGTQKITVTYDTFQTSFNVSVRPLRISSLEVVSNPDKISYFVGEIFDPAGLVLKATYNNGTTKTVTDGFEYSSEAFTQNGNRFVNISYENASVAVIVSVESVKAVSIEIHTLPSKTEFSYKESPDFTGLSVKVKYNNGESEIISAKRDLAVRRVTTENIRRGPVKFSVTAKGLTASFEMTSVLRWWQWLILIFLIGFIWY